MKLELEDEFAIAAFTENIKEMSEAEIKSLLVSLYEQLFHLENHYNRELQKSWLIQSGN